jgi:hypothetical protein
VTLRALIYALDYTYLLVYNIDIPPYICYWKSLRTIYIVYSLIIRNMSDFVDFCNICGIALLQHEVAGDINGSYINYTEHRNGTIQLSLCYDCQNKVLEIIDGGIDKAINMRIMIEGQEPIRSRKRPAYSKRDDDEDGSGGVRPVRPPI